MQTHQTDQDVTVLNDTAEIPGLGFLPVNAYVIHPSESRSNLAYFAGP
jgi:hypothetical protein